MRAMDERPPLQIRLTSAFQKSFIIPVDTERHLAEALAETLQRPGNFIRAELAYSVARACRLKEENAQGLAIAMEYFHTASLLFDDLPSMDNATHRRGALCVHHLYGEGATILAALGLVNRAYALLWRAVVTAPAAGQVSALAYVEKYLGLGGLLNGQSQDIHYSQLVLSQRVPQQIAMGKTVSLIRLSLALPAIVGGADSREIRLLDRLAIVWGLAYQALDDLKDILRGNDQAGKTTARDSLLDRPNLALTLGRESTEYRLRRFVQLGNNIVRRLQRLNASLSCLSVIGERFQIEIRDMSKETLRATG